VSKNALLPSGTVTKRKRAEEMVTGYEFKLLTPRLGGRWASCLPAHKWHSQIFTNYDSGDVTTVCFENPATPPVIARRCSFHSGLTCASDKFEVKLA